METLKPRELRAVTSWRSNCRRSVNTRCTRLRRCQTLQGVPLGMSRICPECADSDPPDRLVADVLLRQEPDEEENEEEDDGDGKEEDDENEEEDDGYSE
jgi:hypothetical protein